MAETAAFASIRRSLRPLTGSDDDYNARLPRQFDAVIHIDETRAVEPLERTSMWETGELPETYPSGL